MAAPSGKGILDAGADDPGVSEPDPDDVGPDPEGSAAEEIIAAVKAGDAAQLKDALTDFVRACMANEGGDGGY